MLTALELAGFKSFAERTRFDFPEGITVIVGPNGSGKSNVVDAIKWVLGAQSAKALRGKDMVDVIFKGSSGSGRKPCNSAEATLVFDNSENHLAVDSEEVQVTRRVYRSGEGEYQINGQPCRLRDIKDLFRGTGVGVDAYSLIEQGKVDRMLQASPKDRRLIFEEAAGISRFNAKKAEAARRLARVDQNMVRLKDIVDEVHTRLSRLKSQATKAQKYREMTAKLHSLRLQLGWTEYSKLGQKAEASSLKNDQLSLEIEAGQKDLDDAKTGAQQAELALHGVAEKCQDLEDQLQDSLQRIAVSKNQQSALGHRIDESLDEQRRHSAKLKALRARAGSLQGEVEAIQHKFAQSKLDFDSAKNNADEAANRSGLLRESLDACNQSHEDLRDRHVELLREVSELSASVAQQKNLLTELSQSIYSTEKQSAENEAATLRARTKAEQSATQLEQVRQKSIASASDLSSAQKERRENEIRLSSLQEQAGVFQGRLQGATERLSILQQLQQHLEGVDAGARHVLDLVSNSDDPAFQTVRGLVAEQLEVDVNLAPLIDTALGNTANALIVGDGQLFQTVRSGNLEVPGRLSLIRLDRLPTRRYGEKVQLDGVRGVIGRADRLVSCKPHMVPLFRYLLGTTWLVENLDVALELGHFRGAGLKFITAACELVDADGTLTIGALQSSAGLVSRRSEIQNAKEEISECKSQYQSLQTEIQSAVDLIGKLSSQVAGLEESDKRLAQELAQRQAETQGEEAKLQELESQQAKLNGAVDELNRKRGEVEPTIAVLVSQVESKQATVNEIEAEIAEHNDAVRSHNKQLTVANEEETAARIELARNEQRLESVKATLLQSTRNQQERAVAVDEAREELLRLQKKQREAELEILQLTSGLAEDFLRSESEESRLEQLAIQAASLRKDRAKAAKRLEVTNRTIDKLTAEFQASELELQRLKESRDSLLKRYREDYEIEFDELTNVECIEDETELQAMDAEASGLRQDISSVGEINMAALAELDELQSRYDYLNGQYEDLLAAKESLQRIIQKINTDSRKMFLETLEIIRQNFQKLYRKSFGGGSADIILEEGEDVLECGIDIIATPPGKTALSNSLLSGGEKALTAVALLLAIFQYRPSPFCVLDEVDAPFDEANIGRFVNVLTEFLDWTKFIIVTHSKKTMTASTTLYGVTMQESGVSKQVAVRFEDVNEKGEILKPNDASHRRAA